MNDKGRKSNQYNSDRRLEMHPQMSRDPHVASDYSHVKKLSVSVYCWTGAQNLLGNRRLQLCDQEMQRINLPRCVLSRLARCV